MREMQISDGWFAGNAMASDSAAANSEGIQETGRVTVLPNALAAKNSAASATPTVSHSAR